MPNKILGILEQREGKLKKASFEVIGIISKLSGQLDLDAEAVVIGGDIENINDLNGCGIKEIIHFKNDELANYSSSAYSKIIFDHAKEISAGYLVFAGTSLGKDLAPSVAVKLNAGCAMDCIDVSAEGNNLKATRPIYAGKALLDIRLSCDTKVITIRPNVFNAAATSQDGNTKITIKEVQEIDLKIRVIEFKKSEDKLDVSEADIIVSGGRGLKGPENFYLVENLAEALGGAVGASRAVVDAGWRPHSEQVGQTGKTVSPSLYIACGISGAIQHLAGMSSSKYIVAVNKDKDAPIFSLADYGIAGDVLEILQALTEEIKKIKS